MLSDTKRFALRALAVAAGGLLLAGLLSQTTVYSRLSWWLDDALQHRFAVSLPMDSVLVVDVDEASMQRLEPQLGAWPYARSVYAKAHRFLVASGARAIAYDILFSEARDGDDAFAAALDQRAVLAAAALPYPYGRPAQYQEQLGHLALRQGLSQPPSQAAARAHAWPDLTLPLAKFTQAARARVGVISTIADADGVVRRTAPLHLAYGKVLPGFPIAALLAAQPDQALRIAGERLAVGDRDWPLADDGSIALRLPANVADLTVVPFHQLLAAADGAAGSAHIGEVVRGRIVFVGSSSAVLGDFALTPAGRLPGLHVNALMVESLQAGQVLSPPQAWLDLALVLLALALPAGLAMPAIAANSQCDCWLAAAAAMPAPATNAAPPARPIR